MTFADSLVRELVGYGVAAETSILGCSTADLEHLSRDQGLPLPGVYRDCMSRFGRGPGSLLYDLDFFYPSIIGIRAETEAMLAEDRCGWSIPGNAFVFSMYQGELIHYFPVDSGDDPPVFRYRENEGQPTQVSARLSLHIRVLVEDYKRHVDIVKRYTPHA
jgi:hypothetical protein